MSSNVIRVNNIHVYKDTIKLCQTNNYPYSQSITYDSLPLTPIPLYPSMSVSVVNCDTFSCCQQLINQGCNIMALNMACQVEPGGGVENGCMAQEENCFRRSNYFMTLIHDLYPIPATGCIYTPTITVIKDQNYQLLDHPFTVSMVACAAIRYPKITGHGTYQNELDRQLMKHKIEQIFQVGYQQHKDTLVLGAFGSGAYRNPPTEVANIFNQVIAQYNRCFKSIVFAIKSLKDPNFDIFSTVIHCPPDNNRDTDNHSH